MEAKDESDRWRWEAEQNIRLQNSSNMLISRTEWRLGECSTGREDSYTLINHDGTTRCATIDSLKSGQRSDHQHKNSLQQQHDSRKVEPAMPSCGRNSRDHVKDRAKEFTSKGTGSKESREYHHGK